MPVPSLLYLRRVSDWSKNDSNKDLLSGVCLNPPSDNSDMCIVDNITKKCFECLDTLKFITNKMVQCILLTLPPANCIFRSMLDAEIKRHKGDKYHLI